MTQLLTTDQTARRQCSTALLVVLGFMAWRSATSIQDRLTETGANTARRLSLSLESQADIERLYSAVGAMLLAMALVAASTLVRTMMVSAPSGCLILHR